MCHQSDEQLLLLLQVSGHIPSLLLIKFIQLNVNVLCTFINCKSVILKWLSLSQQCGGQSFFAAVATLELSEWPLGVCAMLQFVYYIYFNLVWWTTRIFRFKFDPIWQNRSICSALAAWTEQSNKFIQYSIVFSYCLLFTLCCYCINFSKSQRESMQILTALMWFFCVFVLPLKA